jgi:hypothetical protein
MPQLDSLTYFNQYVSFICFFLAIYYSLDSFILPEIALIFKVRSLFSTKNEIGDSSIRELKLTETLSVNSFSTLKDLSQEIDLNSNDWLRNTLIHLKDDDFLVAHNNYMESIIMHNLVKYQDKDIINHGPTNTNLLSVHSSDLH